MAARSPVRLTFLTLALSLVVVASHRTPAEGPELSFEICSDCHEDSVLMLGGESHAGLAGSCADCHSDLEAHIATDGEVLPIGFRPEVLATTRSQACRSCHGTQHPGFGASPHAAAGLACNDCHTVHGSTYEEEGGLAWATGRRSSDACADCHGDVFAEFELNERHRLQEGILDCSSCHDPHAPALRASLGSLRDSSCTDCHADKTGPFVFEHGAQRIEGCTACHTPHGSVNRHMLTFQSVGELCYSCHGAVPGFHARFTLDTVCTNCHSSIHGSNFERSFLK